VRSNRVIGVDLGGTKIRAGVVDRDGSVLARHEAPTPLDSQEALLDGLEAAVRALDPGAAAAVGLGIPSVVDVASGCALTANNIPLAGDIAVAGLLEERLGLPVTLENDANAAALAEWRLGAGRGADDLILLTLGTGVGGGAITGGRLFRGWAEFGHVVVDADGPPCIGACTGRGHLEGLVSGTAANAVAERLYGAGAGAEALVERARAGEEPAVAELRRIGELLGAGIGSLANAFGTRLFVVGGGFGLGAGELVLGPAREWARREALPPARDLAVVPAAFGEGAGVVGAALVAFDLVDGLR
jgi:glucokinase